MLSYADYPVPVVEDIARLRRRIEASRLPGKLTDPNSPDPLDVVP